MHCKTCCLCGWDVFYSGSSDREEKVKVVVMVQAKSK